MTWLYIIPSPHDLLVSNDAILAVPLTPETNF